MQPPSPTSTSKPMLWTGYILSALPALFLLFDAIMKFVKPSFVVEGTTKLGYNANVITPLGAVLLISTLLYIFPCTAVLGAILLTGYLGGAVDCHVRAGDPLFTHILFPVSFGILIWLGLYLRDPRIRALTPVSR